MCVETDHDSGLTSPIADRQPTTDRCPDNTVGGLLGQGAESRWKSPRMVDRDNRKNSLDLGAIQVRRVKNKSRLIIRALSVLQRNHMNICFVLIHNLMWLFNCIASHI